MMNTRCCGQDFCRPYSTTSKTIVSVPVCYCNVDIIIFNGVDDKNFEHELTFANCIATLGWMKN